MMKAKKTYVKPENKKYSVKELLAQERLQEAMEGIRIIQTDLWEQMDAGKMNAEDYGLIERVFDTAIASMMAHLLNIELMEPEAAAGAGKEDMK